MRAAPIPRHPPPPVPPRWPPRSDPLAPAPGADIAWSDLADELVLSGVCSSDRGVPPLPPLPLLRLPPPPVEEEWFKLGGGVGESSAHSASRPWVCWFSKAPFLYTRTNLVPFEHEVVACSRPRLFAEAWIILRMAELQLAGKSKTVSDEDSMNCCRNCTIMPEVAWTGDFARASSELLLLPLPSFSAEEEEEAAAAAPKMMLPPTLLLMPMLTPPLSPGADPGPAPPGVPAGRSPDPDNPEQRLNSTRTFLPSTSNPCDILPKASFAKSTDA